MRTYMIYLLLTGKRLLRQLPYFLAGLAVMVLLVGMAVAFGVSILAIRFLMGYIRKHDFTAFGWYRIALGIVVILALVVLK